MEVSNGVSETHQLLLIGAFILAGRQAMMIGGSLFVSVYLGRDCTNHGTSEILVAVD